MSLQVIAGFSVIDESDDWIVVDKPAPLIVHPANLKPEPTLIGGVEHLLAYEIENGARPAVVNRLDRDTSGLVMIAKHAASARELGRLFEHREVVKEYVAVVNGWPEADEWVVDQPMLRAVEKGPSPIWVRQIVHPDGRACLTRFVVEQRFERSEGAFAVVRCHPETGRMHQIRLHLAHSGYPIVGDKIYSGDGSDYLDWMARGWTEDLAGKLHLPRHALHASRLVLNWKGRCFDWRAPMPLDINEFVSGLKVTEHPDVVIWSRHD